MSNLECEECQQVFPVVEYYFSEVEQRTFRLCPACKASIEFLDQAVNRVSNGVEVLSATTSTALITVPKEAEMPKKSHCKYCHKETQNEDKICNNCSTYLESIKWWSDNYEMGQKFTTASGWEINIDILRQFCTAEEEAFHELLNAQVTKTKRGEYTFFDNNSDILFVGHLDKSWGSLDRNIFAYFEAENGRHLVFNGNLDDREGVFIGMYLLPTVFGIRMDVLLTTNEETGGSTAEDFMEDWLKIPKDERKQYNWIVEFDRHANKPVMYQFEDANLKAMIEEFIETDTGSFTDICHLDKMACKAINWSTGYDQEHTVFHNLALEDLAFNVDAFVKFYQKYHDQHLPHTYSSRHYGLNRYDWNNEDIVRLWAEMTCPRCGETCYERKEIIRPDGIKLKVCWRCYNKHHGEQLHTPVKTHQHLECEECGRKDVIVHIHKGTELCYDCYKNYLAPVVTDSAENFDAPGCSKCGKYANAYVLCDNGNWLCLECRDKEE